MEDDYDNNERYMGSNQKLKQNTSFTKNQVGGKKVSDNENLTDRSDFEGRGKFNIPKILD